MEYEMENLLGKDSLAIRELKSKKKVLERSNALYQDLINLGHKIDCKSMILGSLGLSLCSGYLVSHFINNNMFNLVGIIASVLFFISALFPFGVFIATSKITESQNWTYRYIKKPKSLIEMDTLREEWNQALVDFSPLLEDEKVQFEILKDLNTNRDLVGINQKSQYENIVCWLTAYLKNKEYSKGLETLLNLYELLEDAENSNKTDYYQELKEKFSRPAYESQL